MEASIIILMYNGIMLTHARLVELAKFLPYEDAEVLVVDNGSEDEEVKTRMEWWLKAFPAGKNLRYLQLAKNYGYSIGNNLGAEVALGKYLIFMNNDVIIHKAFLPEIIPMLAGDDKILLGGNIVDWDGGWNGFDIGGSRHIIPYCEGWVLALSKEAWTELGGFDPIYAPYDCEDLDLSMAALEHGFHLSRVPNGLFTHLGGKTFGANLIRADERRKITETNRQKLFQKWKDRIPELAAKVKS